MKNISFLSENFQFLEMKFSLYLNRYVFVINCTACSYVWKLLEEWSIVWTVIRRRVVWSWSALFAQACLSEYLERYCICVNLILCLASYKRNIGKQWRSRSGATERGVWSWYTLFALTHLSLASHKWDLDSVDPDQTPQNAASDQGLHCLHLVRKFLQNMIIIKTNQTPLI